MKKPQEIDKIEIKWNNILPFNGFLAITFFGKMWIRKSNKNKWEQYLQDGRADEVINHEMIHVKQALSTNNSWWKFYMLYIWYWLKANPLFNGFNFAYYMNPFEIEAYGNESDLGYISENMYGTNEWTEYKELKTYIKKEYWKAYLKKKKTEHISFSLYVREYIKTTI